MALSHRQLIMIGVAVAGILTAATAAGAFGVASPAETDTAQTDTGDLAVGNTSDSGQVTAGENTTVWTTLSNSGSEAVTQPVAVRVDLDGDGTFDTTVAEEELTLEAGQSETVALNVGTGQLDPGTYTYGIFVGDSSDSPVGSDQLVVTRPTTFVVDGVDTDASVVRGDSATVTATISNVGDVQGVQTVELTVTNEMGAVEPGVTASKTLSLAPDGTTEVSFTVPTTDLAPGNYDYEVATSDDAAGKGVVVLQPPTFEMKDLTGAETVPRGDTAVLNATVSNTGDVAGTEALALLHEGEIVDETTVSLDSGETTTVTFTTETANYTRGNYTFAVESSADRTETTVRVIDSEFRVDRVRGNETLYIGDRMVFTATVENVGDMNDTQTVEWKLDLNNDDVTESYGITKNVTLAAGEKTDVTFVIPYMEDPDPFNSVEDFVRGTFIYGVYTEDSSDTAVFVAKNKGFGIGGGGSGDGSSGSSGDASVTTEKATLDEIAIQKYGLYYEEISGESQEQLVEIHERQPFADGLSIVDIKTREEIARQDYGLDVGRNDDFDFTSIDIETQQEIEADFDAQFQTDEGDRVESWNELAQAQYGSDYDELTDEQQAGIRDDYLEQF